MARLALLTTAIVMQGAAESLKCCTCSLEGAVCIPLHTSSGFNSQVVCCSVCAAVQQSKRRQVLVEIHKHSLTLSYSKIHVLPPLLYYTVCAAIEAHTARLARIKKRF